MLNIHSSQKLCTSVLKHNMDGTEGFYLCSIGIFFPLHRQSMNILASFPLLSGILKKKLRKKHIDKTVQGISCHDDGDHIMQHMLLWYFVWLSYRCMLLTSLLTLSICTRVMVANLAVCLSICLLPSKLQYVLFACQKWGVILTIICTFVKVVWT